MHPSSVPASAERALMSAFESLPRLQRGRDRGSGSSRGKVEVVVEVVATGKGKVERYRSGMRD